MAPPSIDELPSEIVLDILTRLQRKEVGRCKCVCKPWRRMIRSHPFMEIYRKRQRGYIHYWSEDVDGDVGVNLRHRIRFFHCPFRQVNEPPEDFSPLPSLELETGPGEHFFGMTQLVNGLVCVGDCNALNSDFRLAIHNVCTGEMVRVPNPLPCVGTDSTFHLAYDRASRVYKVLRLIFSRVKLLTIQGAHVITLSPPSGSPSTWRELDFIAFVLPLVGLHGLNEVKMCPDDGMLFFRCRCWVQKEKLLCFDVSQEMFRLIDYPENGKHIGAITRFKDSLALWIFNHGHFFNENGISCYVEESRDEGKNWSKHQAYGDILKNFTKENGHYAGNRLFISSSGEVLLRNHDDTQHVYPYSRPYGQPDKDDVFIVGRLPDEAPDLGGFSKLHRWNGCFQTPFGSGPSCFMDGNNLYMPLDDVFGGRNAIM